MSIEEEEREIEEATTTWQEEDREREEENDFKFTLKGRNVSSLMHLKKRFFLEYRTIKHFFLVQPLIDGYFKRIMDDPLYLATRLGVFPILFPHFLKKILYCKLQMIFFNNMSLLKS